VPPHQQTNQNLLSADINHPNFTQQIRRLLILG